MMIYNVIVFITLLFGVIYASLLFMFAYGILKHRRDAFKSGFEKFSVIVAARNEEAHIAELIERLAVQNYPRDSYEIIIVNDDSSDSTMDIINKYSHIENLKALNSKEYILEGIIGKKKALQIGIEQSSYEMLVFTDADCLPEADWLLEINRHIDEETDFVCGYSPLMMKQNGIISGLKNLERASIFAVGSGSFGLKTAITCTARNMVYRKSNWEKVGRFSKIGHIASGDDDLMLLLQRKEIRKYNFMFSQSSIVPAIEDKDLKAQMHQETRRGSKFKYYPLYLKFICLMTFIFYLGLLASFCLVIADFYYLPVFIGFLLIKLIPEFVLLTVFLSKVKRLKYLVMMPLAELIYIPYFVFFGLKGTFGGYKWKN